MHDSKSEWKGNDKNYVDSEDCLVVRTSLQQVRVRMRGNVNAPENNAWRGKTAGIMKPNGQHHIRDNETKTDNLKSVIRGKV